MEKIKVFTAADIHNIETWLEKIKGSDYSNIDLAIFAGDLTDDPKNSPSGFIMEMNSTAKDFQKWCESRTKSDWRRVVNEELPRLLPNAEIYVLPGNHDSHIEDSSNKRVHVLKRKRGEVITCEIKGVPIKIGYTTAVTYDNLTKFDGLARPPFRNRISSEEDLMKSIEHYKKDVPDIFISHSPVSGKYSNTHLSNRDIGSKALRYASETFLRNTRYFIFGHNHYRPETFPLDFNSEGLPQTFINCSIKRDDSDEWHSPIIFDYIPRLSLRKVDMLYKRYRFWSFKVQQYLRYFERPDWARQCSLCEDGKVPQDEDPSIGCRKCITEKYLNRITEENFLDKEFNIWNESYERAMRSRR